MPQPTDSFDSQASYEAMKKAFENVTALKSDQSPSRQMTFGEKLVGLSFNPSNDSKVDKAKRLCAELMDLVNSERESRETTQLENILYPHTVGEILNAQMNVVKLLTLKY